MGALRVMSYTFDILRAGKQNCAHSLNLPSLAWWDRIPRSPHKLIEWQCAAKFATLHFCSSSAAITPREETAAAKVGLICPTCGCPVWSAQREATLLAYSQHRNRNLSPPPPSLGWASSLHSALEFQLKLDAVARQLLEPIYTVCTASSV